jgi:hypothetical protein
MLWAHRMLFPVKEGKKKVAPVYQIVADRIGRTNTACRIMLHHVKYNVDMGAISLEDALSAKRLPLVAPKKVREQAVEKGAVSRKHAPSRKKAIPGPASKARNQAAAEKRACSPKNAVVDKPLPNQACKSQEQASAERTTSSPQAARAEEPRSGQASKLQKQTTAEKRAFSLEDAPDEKPPSGLTSTLQHLSLDEELSRYRSPEGERVLEAASTLMSMKMQEQGPNSSTRLRHDSFMAGSTFGRLRMPDSNISSTETIEDRSISSTQDFHNYYVRNRA